MDTGELNEDAVHAALADVQTMLDADGYRLETELAGDALRLRIVAGPDACEECLVPKDVMTMIVRDALGPAGADAELVLEHPLGTPGH